VVPLADPSQPCSVVLSRTEGSGSRLGRNDPCWCDFLSDYVKQTLGGDWGNAEIAKPLSERHPVMQWYATTIAPVGMA